MYYHRRTGTSKDDTEGFVLNLYPRGNSVDLTSANERYVFIIQLILDNKLLLFRTSFLSGHFLPARIIQENKRPQALAGEV